MSGRRGIKKSLRFEVFKRDGFICQYCGAHPPAVVLHVDHINPVANGGADDIDNLITACETCNLGKSARSLDDIPRSLQDKAAEIEEREIQIQGYNAILAARAERIESEAWAVIAALENKEHVDSFNSQKYLSIKRFLEKLPFQDVLDAAEIAFARTNSRDHEFKYFCAVCWRKIRGDAPQ